ncbi:MAG: dihydrofolate reductase family protein [Candidatus Acidiferrales bacterium]
MRKIHYCVAMSLDGYIAGPNGEYDWIIEDPEIDIEADFKRFDTALVGRRTFDTMARENRMEIPGLHVIVFSRTLRQSDFPQVTVIAEKQKETVEALRKKPGKELLVWGAKLFHSLLEDGLIDALDIGVIPVLLGAGIPLLPPPATLKKLELTGHKIYKSGIVGLQYAVK